MHLSKREIRKEKSQLWMMWQQWDCELAATVMTSLNSVQSQDVTQNVRTLANKMDELAALVKTQREYRENSVLCFMETWLQEDIPESVDGFQTVWADKDCSESDKYKIC